MRSVDSKAANRPHSPNIKHWLSFWRIIPLWKHVRRPCSNAGSFFCIRTLYIFLFIKVPFLSLIFWNLVFCRVWGFHFIKKVPEILQIMKNKIIFAANFIQFFGSHVYTVLFLVGSVHLDGSCLLCLFRSFVWGRSGVQKVILQVFCIKN